MHVISKRFLKLGSMAWWMVSKWDTCMAAYIVEKQYNGK